MGVVDATAPRCPRRSMYCQMSSSVQLDSGNTRMCSPGPVPPVVQVPQLGPLVARVPLAELVAEARTPAPWPAPSPRPAGRRRTPRRTGLPAMARNSVMVCNRFRLPAGLVGHPARVDVVLHGGDHQPHAEVGHGAVPELDHLVEVVPGVHVQHRERHRRRPERLGRQVQHAPSSPCRRRTAAPAARTWPRPHARCAPTRPRGHAGGTARTSSTPQKSRTCSCYRSSAGGDWDDAAPREDQRGSGDT